MSSTTYRNWCGLMLVASFAACAPVASEPGGAPGSAAQPAGATSADGGALRLVRADPTWGVSATWDDGTTRLALQAELDQATVRSTITEGGRVVTRLEVPLAGAGDLADDLGPLALEMSRDQALVAVDAAMKDHLRDLLPVYAKALSALYQRTEALGDSSLRMALPWHEEVLARLVLDGADDEAALAPCPKNEGPVHTAFMHRPELTSLMRTMRVKAGLAAPLCDLGCSWYDICCYHDEACVYCDHWWCGWSCVPGCFGGDCGGGR